MASSRGLLTQRCTKGLTLPYFIAENRAQSSGKKNNQPDRQKLSKASLLLVGSQVVQRGRKAEPQEDAIGVEDNKCAGRAEETVPRSHDQHQATVRTQRESRDPQTMKLASYNHPGLALTRHSLAEQSWGAIQPRAFFP